MIFLAQDRTNDDDFVLSKTLVLTCPSDAIQTLNSIDDGFVLSKHIYKA